MELQKPMQPPRADGPMEQPGPTDGYPPSVDWALITVSEGCATGAACQTAVTGTRAACRRYTFVIQMLLLHVAPINV